MGLAFEKYQGAGNDFLIVAAGSADAVSPAEATKLCDRRFGVGGDGVLLVLPPHGKNALARMRVINADGSVPEMCGNGLRCVALHLARKHGQKEILVETDAGERLCAMLPPENGVPHVRIDMGPVIVGADVKIDTIAGRALMFTRANVGNPHAVTWDDWTRALVDHAGPIVATHAAFPGGTNVEFSRITDAGIDLVVWERGVGVTHACGTGACATVAVAVAQGKKRAGVPVAVSLPGGVLRVTISEHGLATLEGPAAFVFAGHTGEGA